MTCRDVEALAALYLDGETPEELGHRIQRHLLRCAACREELETQRMAVQVLRATHAPASPSEAWIEATLERLMEALGIHDAEAPAQLTLRLPAPRMAHPESDPPRDRPSIPSLPGSVPHHRRHATGGNQP